MASCYVLVDMAAVATANATLLLPCRSKFPQTNAGKIAFGYRYRLPATVPIRLSRRCVRDSESQIDHRGFLPQEDLSYLVKLGAGSVAAAAVIKYGSGLFPEITKPDITRALFTIFLPVIVAVVLLIGRSRSE